jgi:hypothetical protein
VKGVEVALGQIDREGSAHEVGNREPDLHGRLEFDSLGIGGLEKVFESNIERLNAPSVGERNGAKVDFEGGAAEGYLLQPVAIVSQDPNQVRRKVAGRVIVEEFGFIEHFLQERRSEFPEIAEVVIERCGRHLEAIGDPGKREIFLFDFLGSGEDQFS